MSVPKSVVIQPATKPVAQSGASAPTEPASPPSKKLRKQRLADAAIEFSAKPGVLEPELVDCMCINVTAAACQAGSDSADEALCDILMSIPGRYWKVGMYPDFPVYRQEANPDYKKCQQLFLFYKVEPANEQGWYIAQSIAPPAAGDGGLAYCQAQGTNQ